MAALGAAVRWMPVSFDQRSLLNYDAATRPWSQMPTRFPRTAFDPESLISYEVATRSRLLEAIRTQSALIEPRTVKVRADALEGVFGQFHTNHAFRALRPDWGIDLTEPMATRGLAHLLNRGSGDLRAQRIRAFLTALKIPRLPDDYALAEAKVYSEKDHIDLEIHFHGDDGHETAVLVEAKLGHTLTAGQLKRYYGKRSRFDRQCRIVGLTPEAGDGRKGTQNQIWQVVLWRDLWLAFERQRPDEDDGQLAAFMAWLWLCIGGLNAYNSTSR